MVNPDSKPINSLSKWYDPSEEGTSEGGDGEGKNVAEETLPDNAYFSFGDPSNRKVSRITNQHKLISLACAIL